MKLRPAMSVALRFLGMGLFASVTWLSGLVFAFASEVGHSAEKIWADAELIVIGNVKSSRVEEIVWAGTVGDDVHYEEFVMTAYTMQVERVLKGEYPSGLIDVHTMGGVLNGRVYRWSFGFDLEPQTEYVLFLLFDDFANVWYVNNNRTGVFTIHEEGSEIAVKGLIDDSELIFTREEGSREEFLEKRNAEVARRISERD